MVAALECHPAPCSTTVRTEHEPQFVLIPRDLPGVSHGPSVAYASFIHLCLADSMTTSD